MFGKKDSSFGGDLQPAGKKINLPKLPRAALIGIIIVVIVLIAFFIFFSGENSEGLAFLDAPIVDEGYTTLLSFDDASA